MWEITLRQPTFSWICQSLQNLIYMSYIYHCLDQSQKFQKPNFIHSSNSGPQASCQHTFMCTQMINKNPQLASPNMKSINFPHINFSKLTWSISKGEALFLVGICWKCHSRIHGSQLHYIASSYFRSQINHWIRTGGTRGNGI